MKIKAAIASVSFVMSTIGILGFSSVASASCSSRPNIFKGVDTTCTDGTKTSTRPNIFGGFDTYDKSPALSPIFLAAATRRALRARLRPSRSPISSVARTSPMAQELRLVLQSPISSVGMTFSTRTAARPKPANQISSRATPVDRR